MAGAAIVINQAGKPPGLPSTSREDLDLAVLVNLSNFDDGGVISWTWTLLDIPPGSAAVLSDPNVPDPTFTPDVRGTYRIRLVTVDGGGSHQDIRGAAVDFDNPGLWRAPAYGEQLEWGTKGWHLALYEVLSEAARGRGSYLVSLKESAGDPAPEADYAHVYAKQDPVTGFTEVFARASDGTVTQLTPSAAGALTLQTAYDNGELVTLDAQGAIELTRGALCPDADAALVLTDANANSGRLAPLLSMRDLNVGTPDVLWVSREVTGGRAVRAQVFDADQVAWSSGLFAPTTTAVVFGDGDAVFGDSAMSGGGEKLRVVGALRVEGKLTVTGAIDPTSLSIVDVAGSAAFVDSGTGASAGVAAADHGRLRYAAGATQRWQASANGGAYANLALVSDIPATPTLQQVYDAGPGIICDATGAVTISSAQNDATYCLELSRTVGTGVALRASHAVSGAAVATFRSTSATSAGASVALVHESASPADGDTIGRISLYGYDTIGGVPTNLTRFCRIDAIAATVGNGEELGKFTFSAFDGGVDREHFLLVQHGYLELRSYAAGAAGPTFEFHYVPGTPADGDIVGLLTFYGYDMVGGVPTNKTRYGRIDAIAVEVDHGSEEGRFDFYLQHAAAEVEVARFAPGVTTLTHDDDGALGQTLKLAHVTANPAALDVVGRLGFWGYSDAPAVCEFGRIDVRTDDVAAGSMDGRFMFHLQGAGALRNFLDVLTNSTSDVMCYTPGGYGFYSTAAVPATAILVQFGDSGGVCANISGDGSLFLNGLSVAAGPSLAYKKHASYAGSDPHIWTAAYTSTTTGWETAVTVALNANCTHSTRVTITGRNSAGTAWGSYELAVGAHRVAGGAVLDAYSLTVISETDGSWDVRAVANGNNIEIQVLGHNPTGAQDTYWVFDLMEQNVFTGA